MIIEPKTRGFICTTAHPVGCERNIREEIDITRQQGPIEHGPKRALVVGSSSGYGMASRIVSAFGAEAATIGVFFEKAPTEKRTASAGWYNAAAFDKLAREAGLYAKSFNGDAFSHAAKEKVIELIREDLGQINLLVYSLASPVRKMPDSGETVRSALKPIGKPFRSTAIDTNKDEIIEAEVEPATDEEIAGTVTVMGGEDWKLWIDALKDAGVLAEGFKTVAYSYIGTEITWPIYWEGALGKAKQHLDQTAATLRESLADIDGEANVAMLKSVVTQASAAIPVMPLYLSIVFKVMKEKGLHEGCIEQINRLFRTGLYGEGAKIDEEKRYRLDDWELRDDVQQACRDIWPQVTTENLFELTDYASYKKEFLKLFGFGVEGVDYAADVSPLVEADFIAI